MCFGIIWELRTENRQHTTQVVCWQARHKRHNGHNTNLDFEDWYHPIDHLRTKVLGRAWATNTIVKTNTFKYNGSLPKHLWNNRVIATTNLCMSWSLLKRTPKEEGNQQLKYECKQTEKHIIKHIEDKIFGESYWVATCRQTHKMWKLLYLFSVLTTPLLSFYKEGFNPSFQRCCTSAPTKVYAHSAFC